VNIEYHPLSVEDLIDAKNYYDQQQLGLSQAFQSEVFLSIERIRSTPLLYAKVDGVRRALLEHFPFSIVYRLLNNDTVRILLIRHHKRHPNFGSERK
jgi:toxin ParE1/3/4